ncbi:MAG: radical SAM protein, partial [Armatimonadetes bacterium]|nr:radical SAM protein [Armatimonadota bacterium]
RILLRQLAEHPGLGLPLQPVLPFAGQLLAGGRDDDHGRGDAVPAPVAVRRDVAVVGQVLETIAAVWSGYSEIEWSQIRASAWRLRHEDEYRAHLAPGALKVALVNAPWAVDGRIGVRAGSRWPFTQDSHGQRVPCYVPFPFFLATAAAMLKREGFEVIIIDAIAEGLYAEEFMRRVEGFAPDVVLMETATASHEIDLDWCLQFKEQLGDDLQVVLCGPHASALDTALMNEAPQVDAIVLGEYEPSFLDLMVALRDGGDLSEIPGLLWRDTAGQVHVQQQRRELPPLSSFPWPERETLPMYNYFDSFANAMPWPNVQMHASRGCPFKCIFCVWPQVVYDGQNYRTRDNADIVAEMSWLVDRYGFKAVYFDDDTFNIDNERIIDLCDRIAAADLKVPICAMGRADTSNREAYEAMKRAGVVGLKFGVETGDPEMMKRIRKHLDLDKVRRTVGWCKELGIGVHLTFSFGGPGETRETAEKTIRLALELDADTVQFSLMTPFPGTTMYEAALANGTLLTTDWKQYDGARYTVVRGEYLTREELEEVLREAHRRWLMHISERDAVKGLDRPWRPQERRQVTTAELPDLPAGSLESLHLIEPIERIWYEGASPRALAEVLEQAQTRLRPEGLLLLTRSREDTCPPAWRDALLLE